MCVIARIVYFCIVSARVSSMHELHLCTECWSYWLLLVNVVPLCLCVLQHTHVYVCVHTCLGDREIYML